MERTAASIPLERRSIEAELAVRVRQQAALADLGLRALAGMPVEALLDEAVHVVSDSLDVEFVGLLEWKPATESLWFRNGVGWRAGIVGSTVPVVAGSGVQYILRSIEPVVVDDLTTETRFRRSNVLAEHGVRSVLGVVILGTDSPFGILGAHSTRPFAFTADDAAFLQTVANLVGEAIRRSKAEEATRLAFQRQQEAVDRLQSLDEMKNTFLEAVSHELRTPLASVLGFALTLEARHTSLSTEEIHAVLARLSVNARKLDRLLRDLLDLDRLYRRVIVPKRRPTDLSAIIRSATAESDLNGRTVHLDNTPIVINVDAAKVERIIENLLINVVRHTPPEASIWVRVEPHPDGAVLVVEDDGPGVPDVLKGSIFDVFQRGATAHPHSPGTGIGLSLVVRFAELHGGRAWVEDRPGGGARFCVVLPDPPDTTPDVSAPGLQAPGL